MADRIYKVESDEAEWLTCPGCGSQTMWSVHDDLFTRWSCFREACNWFRWEPEPLDLVPPLEDLAFMRLAEYAERTGQTTFTVIHDA